MLHFDVIVEAVAEFIHYSECLVKTELPTGRRSDSSLIRKSARNGHPAREISGFSGESSRLVPISRRTRQRDDQLGDDQLGDAQRGRPGAERAQADARWIGGLVELTVIVLGLLLAVGGLTVVAGLVARAIAARGPGLLGQVRQLAERQLAARKLADRPGPGSDLGRRIRDRLRIANPGLLALSLAAGLALIALAAVGLGKLVDDVTEGDGVAGLDHPVAHFVASHRVPAMTSVMRATGTFGGPVTIVLFGSALGVLLSVRWHSWAPVLAMAATGFGIGGLTIVFKTALGRSRPPLAQAVAAADGYGFPSGHAAAAAAVCGVAAWLITSAMRSWRSRVAVWAVAAIVAAFVGVSRIYLGVHWTTDVLGGWAFGTLWMAVVVSGWVLLGSVRRVS